MTPAVWRVVVAVLRDLAAAWGRVTAVAALTGAGIAVYVGTYAAIDSLFHTRDRLFERGRFADLEVLFDPEDAANLPDLASLEGVAGVQPRLVLPGSMPHGAGGGRRLAALIYFLDERWPQEVNSLTLLRGGPLAAERPEGALIERSLARYHGLGVGDALALTVGEKRYALRVDGVVLSPEFLMTSASPSFIIPARGSLGVIYTSIRQFEAGMGFRLYNSLAVRYAAGYDRKALRQRVVDALEQRVSPSPTSSR